MRRIAKLFVITMGLALFGPLALTADAAPGKKFAVIDLVRAISEHPRTKVIEDNMRKAQVAAQKEQKAEAERFKTLKAELDGMGEMAPRREFTEKKLLQLRNTMKFNAEWAELVATRNYVRDLEQIYKSVVSVVGLVARERGHEVVFLRTDPNQKLNSTSREDFALKTRLRVVVFADSSCDITQAVIDKIKPKNK